MPKKALQKQKRYMRRFLKKLLDMKVKNFAELVIIMNKLLTRLPNTSPTVPAAKIMDNKILYILESTMPISWQRHMILQGFDPMGGTIAELAVFCEQIKLTEELPAVKKSNQDKTGKDPNKGDKKGNKKHKPEGEISNPYNCMLHRPSKTHNIENCYALKNLVKGTKNRKKDPGQQKYQKVQGNKHANVLCEKAHCV